MAEVQRRYYLAEELPGLLGCQSPLLYQVIKQLTSRDMLQNQVPGEDVEGAEGWKGHVEDQRAWSLSFKSPWIPAQDLNSTDPWKQRIPILGSSWEEETPIPMSP